MATPRRPTPCLVWQLHGFTMFFFKKCIWLQQTDMPQNSALAGGRCCNLLFLPWDLNSCLLFTGILRYWPFFISPQIDLVFCHQKWYNCLNEHSVYTVCLLLHCLNIDFYHFWQSRKWKVTVRGVGFATSVYTELQFSFFHFFYEIWWILVKTC